MDKYTQELFNDYVRKINHSQFQVNRLENEIGMRNMVILVLSLALVASLMI